MQDPHDSGVDDSNHFPGCCNDTGHNVTSGANCPWRRDGDDTRGVVYGCASRAAGDPLVRHRYGYCDQHRVGEYVGGA